MLQTPIGEIRDPVKGQDFEGVGVTPDIAVPASEALLAAQKVLLQGRVEAGDADARWAMVPIEFAISGQTASASGSGRRGRKIRGASASSHRDRSGLSLA
jgi:Mrp family chromosome partitioning ATPase